MLGLSIRFWRNAVLVGIVASAILPVIPVLIWCFSTGWHFPSLIPDTWTARGWIYVTEPYSRAFPALVNSLLIASVVTLISFPIGIPAARALGLHRFRGKRFIEFLILAPLIVPELPLAIGIHILFIKYGLSNTLLGVMVIHLILVVPYVVLVLAGVFANYGPETEESARTLGASPLQVFFHITLPAIFPGMVVGGLFAFIRSWRTYVFTLIIGGGVVETLPLAVFSFIGEGDNHMSAVLSMLFIAPAVLMLVFTARYLTGERGRGGFVGI
ncbi:MAG: ABC transporter permease subunit [Rhodospirillales bacterium]|nr:ABC transporter permease subunit [Rhodospirillales bacterium]